MKRRHLILACLTALAACQQRVEPAESVESLVSNPERLAELREKCRQDHASVGDIQCNRVPNGMDGAGGLTQPHIPPGKTFVYEFEAKRPGTFMYHPHADEMVQMAMGMMGFWVTHPKNPKFMPWIATSCSCWAPSTSSRATAVEALTLEQRDSQWLTFASCPTWQRHIENVVAPSWHVDVKPVRHQLISVAIVSCRAHQVAEAHALAAQIVERQSEVALATVRRVIDDHEPAIVIPGLP